MSDTPPVSAGAGDGRAPLRAYPPTVTYKDLLRANKRKSALLMAAMIALGVLIGAVIGAAIGVGNHAHGDWGSRLPVSAALGAVAALVVATFGATWSWFQGASAILRLAGAHEIDASTDPELFNIVDEVRIAAGLPMPRVFEMDTHALNAFATGRDPRHAAVAVTRGLRATLTRDELAAVMAHEMAHVRHLDVRFAMLLATMVGLIVMASDAAWRMMRFAPRARSSKDGGGAAMVIFMVAILLAVVAAPLAMLIQFAFSRQREYLADAGAVELTRNPEALISALEKLQNCDRPLTTGPANRAIAHLFIVSPLEKQMKAHQEWNSAFSTHPPMHKRIERLRALLR